MAASLVGGAFLSASVQTIMDKLCSAEFHDYINNKKLNVSLLKQLKTTLLTLQVVLDDAEQKQINNPAVKQWLDELKDAVFDAEDLLNEIGYDSLRCKVESTHTGNKTNQVWNFFSSSPFKSFYSEINSQMKVICERLQIFAQNKDILGLQTVSGRVSRRIPSSSIVNESVTVGRKHDKERLMNMLLTASSTSSNNTGVVAILGMGGVGKTTLAQLLYNDKEVQQHFELKAWACVSEDFDILRVTKTLLESVTSRTWESNNLDFLRVELKRSSREKRFLFVLDDLWNENYNDWDELVSPFIDGKSGSMVIVTTRQQKVAEVAHTLPIHKLEPLSYEDCWSLLSKHAFGRDNFHENKYTNLEAIGRKIARKCGGLPIAAKTLGGILRSKVDKKEWTAILNSDIWNLPNDNILPALLLSYQYLPSHLKRCFAYCSIFPKDYLLDRNQLVLLWMAEGFLEHFQAKKTAEEIGEDCFVELLSRSLIQPSDRIHRFVMHTVVSGKSCCKLECGGNISKNAHHFSYTQEEYDIFKKFETLYDLKCLRSFLPIDLSIFSLSHYNLSKMVVDDFLPTLRRLRVLSLSKYKNITMLPDSIGSLVQLRYLDLSHTRVKSLPETTCSLYHLQTLILSKCEDLTELPVHIGELINLRHLDISETKIKELPMQVVGLENLQTLTVFVVGEPKIGLSVQELGMFPNLRGRLCIKNLHNVIDAMEAYDANLHSKEHIETLELQWDKQTEDSRTDKLVLEGLQPSRNLKELRINLYGGTSFSGWLGDSLYSNMVDLSITNCEYCVTLPPLGKLPSLKKLIIHGMRILETIGPEFYGMTDECSNPSFQPFPSLERLEFKNMSNWKQWLPFEGNKFPFPCLKVLRLIKCPELREHLPRHLYSIKHVRIDGCDRLLATPPTLGWLSSIESVYVGDSIGLRTPWLLFACEAPCLLQRIRIFGCDTLLSLPKMIMNSTCFQRLELYSVPSLIELPTHGPSLPTSLQSLIIYYCNNLAFLPVEMWNNYTSLVTLELHNSCHALTSFPLDGFPKLQSLSIKKCKRLESIFISESFSPLRPSTLQSFEVKYCKALRSLPQRMDTLTALEKLTLEDLPELELSFCEGACLPSKLQSISIESVRRTTHVAEWGLQHLHSLSNLYIGGNDDMVKTLSKERLLPISLVSLTITLLSKTKCLDVNGLRHLSSLETLCFYNCTGLESFSADRMPSCLETLEFEGCRRLGSFPEDKFPSSLRILTILDCSQLEARYKRREHWSKIAHIPVININGQVTI